MNKIEIRNMIEATIKSGSKNPWLFDLPKILGVKSKTEACTSINDVVATLEDNHSLISKSFGLNDIAFNESVSKLKCAKNDSLKLR